MTEDDYINVSDMVTLSSAKRVLSNICPESSEVINTDDFKMIVSLLSEWEIKLSEKEYITD